MFEFIFLSNLFELLQFSEDLNYLNGFKLNLIEIWKPHCSHGRTHCYFGLVQLLGRLGSGRQPSYETGEAVETMPGWQRRLNPVSQRQRPVGEAGKEHASDSVCLIWGVGAVGDSPAVALLDYTPRWSEVGGSRLRKPSRSPARGLWSGAAPAASSGRMWQHRSVAKDDRQW
jgi:hypothetical protein